MSAEGDLKKPWQSAHILKFAESSISSLWRSPVSCGLLFLLREKIGEHKLLRVARRIAPSLGGARSGRKAYGSSHEDRLAPAGAAAHPEFPRSEADLRERPAGPRCVEVSMASIAAARRRRSSCKRLPLPRGRAGSWLSARTRPGNYGAAGAARLEQRAVDAGSCPRCPQAPAAAKARSKASPSSTRPDAASVCMSALKLSAVGAKPWRVCIS